jgi:hypothetical protein
VAGVVGACGSPPLTVDEFCELARQADVETVRLVQLPRGTVEFDDQLELVRSINDRMFSNAPAEITEVAEELRPLLTDIAADNDRVNVLLDQVAAYVEQNCSAP